MLRAMRLAAALAILFVAACRRPVLEPVGTSPPRPLPPLSESPLGDAGVALPEEVHQECELLIDAFAQAKANDPNRPARKILEAVFEDPPPMPIERLEWCRKELLRIVER